MRTKNLLIRASAGTGKTFSLATHFIWLLVCGEKPEHILALTFSRAATQEIYEKILKRLWIAAATEKGAGDEAEILREYHQETMGQTEALPGSLDMQRFRVLLRQVMESQYLGNIATLDSFILRLVSNFPLELGFQNAVKLLDDYQTADALKRARETLLNNGEGELFKEVYQRVQGDEWPRTLRERLDTLMDTQWRDYLLSHGDHLPTEAGMRQVFGLETPIPTFAEEEGALARFTPDELGQCVCSVKTGEPNKTACRGLVNLQETLRTYRGETFLTFTAQWLNAARAGTLTSPFKAGNSMVSMPDEVLDAVVADIARADKLFLQARIQDTCHQLALIRLIEEEYHTQTRQAGRLTFNDLPQVQQTFQPLTQSKEDVDALIMNVEYRFDSTFRHWELDEFQDTSAMQWACLKNLVQTAAEDVDAGRSVVTVGDLKQAIYAWRGGDDKAFTSMMAWAVMNDEDYGQVKDLDISYRYGKHICDFLNVVFSEENLLAPHYTFLSPFKEALTEKWLDKRCWRKHEPDPQKEKKKIIDYIRVEGVSATADASDVAMKGLDEVDGKVLKTLAPSLLRSIQDLYNEHQARQSTDTIGILVRNNAQGAALASLLRQNGLPVVWEGVSAIRDVPAVEWMLCLLTLAEHPDDTAAWQMLNHSPMKAHLPGAEMESVSIAMAESLSKVGLARTLQTFVKAFCDTQLCPTQACDEEHRNFNLHVQSRLNALIRAAVQYEALAKSTTTVDDFKEYLNACTNREIATGSSAIRILTIHRSKGLTIDHVFVPLLDTTQSNIVKPKNDVILSADATRRSPAWALSGINETTAHFHPALQTVWQHNREEVLLENLHTYYVAFTRAEKSMYVFFPFDAAMKKEEDKKTKTTSLILRPTISAIVAHALGLEDDGERVYERGELQWGQKDQPHQEISPWQLKPGKKEPKRTTPSLLQHTSSSGSDAISPFAGNFNVAAKRGIETHAKFAAIEWLEPKEAMTALERELVKPSAGATVWREKAYEFCHQGFWESGCIDRVVFYEDGTATISDYKTNARRSNETKADFEHRLWVLYKDQLLAYRNALHALTGIPKDNIRIQLLATATQSVIRQ